MGKVATGTNVFINPMPIVLVGVREKSKANFITVGWVTRVNTNPPMVAVSISKSHYTAELIREARTFSINVPGADMADKVDYCGLVSGKDVDKSALFDVFFGTLKTAPMISECPLCLECKLVDTLPMKTNYLFIGEIAGAFTEEKYLTDGLPDPEKINPLVLTMPDTSYRTLGKPAGKAWSDGKKLMKK
ncbi:MAG: Flavin reductase like domain protein [Methanocella sp. PtaU1.Bin125]|nr:MAG: Flavin reductase like domain protein [Methanocella sp. PtaU1.Bin125]